MSVSPERKLQGDTNIGVEHEVKSWMGTQVTERKEDRVEEEHHSEDHKERPKRCEGNVNPYA